MSRHLAVILAMLVTSAWGQEGGQARDITVEPTQVFSTLSERPPSGNAGMFVGVNDFVQDQGLSQLDYAVHDAIETAYLFAFELRLIRPNQCHLLLSGEPASKIVRRHLVELQQHGAIVGPANRNEILATFVRVASLSNKPSDLLVCSLSSHGFEDRGDAYVMPANGFRALLADTAVPLKTIELKMEEARAGHRLLLVDACQERVPAKGVGQAGEPAGNGLIKALQTPSGQAKLASCSSGEFSYEHGSLGGVGHGVFTWAFLEALRGGAKADQEQLIRLGSVADYVATRVAAWTKANRRKKQTPFLKSPIATRNLPLAEKADDLTTLIVSLRRHAVGGAFTEQLRTQLTEYLSSCEFSSPADRKLLTYTQRFLVDELPQDVFVAYVKQDKERWSAPRKPDSNLTNSIGMQLSLIPAGKFTMGSRIAAAEMAERFNTAPEHFAGEHPLHDVQVSQPFYLGSHEVSIGQFRTYIEESKTFTTAESDGRGGGLGWDERWLKGSQFSWQSYGWRTTDDHPVANVSWDDAVAFCRWLSQKERRTYRLPTEAEWEYACRADTTTLFFPGNDVEALTQYGNIPDGDAEQQFPIWNTTKARDGHVFSAPVGQFKPNSFGLYDMHGNVWEWCSDAYHESYYQTLTAETAVDPQGPDPTGITARVLRGGSWSNNPLFSRSASRNGFEKDDYFYNYGFRVVCELPATQDR